MINGLDAICYGRNFRRDPGAQADSVWGDNERQARISMEDVSCLDVVCCRLNALMERLRPIPIGCPIDELETVGDRALADVKWALVNVYGQNGDGWQDAPELNRLYGGPHLFTLELCFLMQDSLVTRSMTLPGAGCHCMLDPPRPT